MKKYIGFLTGAAFVFVTFVASSPSHSMGKFPVAQDASSAGNQATTAVPPPMPPQAPHRAAPKPQAHTIIKTIQVPAVCPIVEPTLPMIKATPALLQPPKQKSLLDDFEMDWWKVANGLVLLFFGVLVFLGLKRGYAGYKSALVKAT